MKSDSKLVLLIILIVVAIIVSVLVFRNYYKTEQERNDHQNRLYIGIGVGILIAVVITYMLGSDNEQEYGGGFSALFKKKTAQPKTGYTPAPARGNTPAPAGAPPKMHYTSHSNTVISGTTYAHGDGGKTETYIIE